jgi:hypothetical protein
VYTASNSTRVVPAKLRASGAAAGTAGAAERVGTTAQVPDATDLVAEARARTPAYADPPVPTTSSPRRAVAVATALLRFMLRAMVAAGVLC